MLSTDRSIISYHIITAAGSSELNLYIFITKYKSFIFGGNYPERLGSIRQGFFFKYCILTIFQLLNSFHHTGGAIIYFPVLKGYLFIVS